MQVNQTSHAKNTVNFIKVILKIKHKMSNITGKIKHYERLINVLLNKTDTCRGGNKHKKHITIHSSLSEK